MDKTKWILLAIILFLGSIIAFQNLGKQKLPIEIEKAKYDSLQAEYDTLTMYAELVKSSMQLKLEAKDAIIESKIIEIKKYKSKIKTDDEIRVSASNVPVNAKVDSLRARFCLFGK